MLQLKTMGIFEARWSNTPLLQFDSDKTRALLAYLAVESERPHRRAALAALFWPEKPESAARHSLSQSIYYLHSILPEGSVLIHSMPQSVEFHPQAELWLDARVFKDLLQDVDRHCPVSSWVCHACLENLEKAIRLYQGEFLTGFSLGGCEMFESWLTVQREMLKLELNQTLESLVTCLINQGVNEKGLAYAQLWYSQDDLNEIALRHVMQLLAVLGQRNEALNCYRVFEDRLYQELQVAPEPETTCLFRQLLDNSVIRKHRPVKSFLSYPLVPILGRQEELGLIEQKMRLPDCRLLTILGPGGMGKTRLAQEASLRLQALFLDGVYWVDLDTRQGEEELFLPIARAVGLSPRVLSDMTGYHPQGTLKSQLIDLLLTKRILLVLDGIECKLEHAHQLSELLHQLPHVKILVTSRVRLNLEGEQVLLLQELHYPRAESVPANAEDYPAVCLFLESARRINPYFLPDPAELAAVVCICQFNQGLPLGILLSSAWVGTLAPSQIITEIQKNLEFLSTGWQDLPERQRTLLATFDFSWQLLDQDLRLVFIRLAVFQGDFTSEQAIQVTETSLVQLKSLVDHTLLQHSGETSFRMHNLLRQYALRQLASFPTIYQAVKERHCALFLENLAAFEPRLKSSAQFEALADMDNQLPDLLSAWDWAASHQRLEQLAGGARALEYYRVLRGGFSEAIGTFRKALTSLKSTELAQDTLIAWVNLSLRLAFSLLRNHEFSQAADLVEKIDFRLQTLDENDRLTFLLRGEAAMLKAMLGEFYYLNNQDAFGHYQVCLKWMRAFGEPWPLSHSLYRISMLQAILENKHQTEKVAEEALLLQQQIGDPALTSKIKVSLLYMYTMSGQNDEAIRMAQELDIYFRRVGTRQSLARSAMLLGLSFSHAMQFELSNVHMDKALTLLDPAKNYNDYDFCAYMHTWNCLYLGDYEAVRQGLTCYGHGPDGVILPNWKIIRGYLYLLDFSYELAEADFNGFVDHNRYIQRLDVLGQGLGLLSYSAYLTRRYPESYQHLVQALENGLEHGYFIAIVISLQTLDLILAETEELEQAAALFQFLNSNFIKRTVLFEELFGKRIRPRLGALPLIYQPERPWIDLITPAKHYLEKLKHSDNLFDALASHRFG